MKKLFVISVVGLFLFSCEKEEIRPNSQLNGCYDSRGGSSDGKDVNSSIENGSTTSSDPITDPNKDKDEGGRRKQNIN